MTSAIVTAFEQRLAMGQIKADPAQRRAAERLARLEQDMATAGPGLFSLKRRPRSQRGVYLYGPVGRGKSMLMDLFFETVPVDRKRRVHFHAFMARVHSLIRQWREGDGRTRKAVFGQNRGDDPVAPVAALLASEASLICFDELQITDIADAMILGRLFQALFSEGVTLVATSNRAPEDLYLNGLNRQLFLPTIAMLNQQLEVVSVAGETDYRLDRLKQTKVWLAPNDVDHRRVFDRLWLDLVGTSEEVGAELEVLGRRIGFPRTCGSMVRTHFSALCEQALGPQDYLALADRFGTILLEDVPRLPPSRRDSARRFNTLVDALYEAGCRLVVTAEVKPCDLYPEGDGAFEFERTISRLEEMQSSDWLERHAMTTET